MSPPMLAPLLVDCHVGSLQLGLWVPRALHAAPLISYQPRAVAEDMALQRAMGPFKWTHNPSKDHAVL